METDNTPQDERAVLDHGFVRVVSWMGDDAAIARAARVSYGETNKTPDEDRRLIARLMRDHHTSPFEHVVFTLHVKAPIFVARQWMRHRTWSYSEQSQRYAATAPEFYLPDAENIRAQSAKNKQGSGAPLPADRAAFWRYAISMLHHTMHDVYTAMLAEGVSRELARIILPLSTYTQFYGTVDLHNLFHFLRLRRASDAQYEIRCYAAAIEALIAPIVPAAYAAFTASLGDAGKETP